MTRTYSENRPLVIIGAGPAGLAAALAAYREGTTDILLLERDKEAGGILNQCIHNGFGLHRFQEELTGPEYAERFRSELAKTPLTVRFESMVLDLTPANGGYELRVVSPQNGYEMIFARSVILAMGCRERTRGAIGIPGDRPSGIFTAGTAQRLMNREGFAVGRRVVILGSGDIGLIMARRLTLEGAKVLSVVELMPYSNGLARNIAQCLDDYGIPLQLSRTVVEIRGKRRLEAVVLADVDANRQPIPGTETVVPCDTLLLSVGLIPENELSRQAGIAMDPKTRGPLVYENRETSLPGVFACGNVLHVHDLVDFVSEEAEIAGRGAAQFLQAEKTPSDSADETILLQSGDGVGYVLPQKIRRTKTGEKVNIYMRVKNPSRNRGIRAACDGQTLKIWRKPRLAPAEMECVPFSNELLANVRGTITFDVVDGEEKS